MHYDLLVHLTYCDRYWKRKVVISPLTANRFVPWMVCEGGGGKGREGGLASKLRGNLVSRREVSSIFLTIQFAGRSQYQEATAVCLKTAKGKNRGTKR